VALANKNLLWDAMLRTFGSGLKGANVTNHLILALDQETLDFCRSEGLNSHRMDVDDLKVCGPAHRWASGAWAGPSGGYWGFLCLHAPCTKLGPLPLPQSKSSGPSHASAPTQGLP